jgi:hypothetical protein
MGEYSSKNLLQLEQDCNEGQWEAGFIISRTAAVTKNEKLKKYMEEFDHPYERNFERDAASSGHGIMDFFCGQRFH